MLRSASVTLALLAALSMTPEEMLIRHTAGAMGVDADYAACIAWHESRFDPQATGALGEEGLFQILPATGEWIAAEWGWADYDGYDAATNAMMGVWLIQQGHDDWFSTKGLCIKEFTMAKTSRVFQQAQDEQIKDTAIEMRHMKNLAEYHRSVWRAAADGEITAAELAEITQAAQVVQASGEESLQQNRVVASLLCCEAGRLDPQAPKTLERLPALKLLAAEEPEEDWAA